MRYLSLFSGIEAATVAWHPLGWECVGVSEIEPYPCKLLAAKYPHVPNLGDVTKITEEQIKVLGQIDLIVFGSPCQDLSVAGKRRGLDGARSGLFFTAMQIVQWARQHNGTRFALWENVPGAFSSAKGEDFAAVVRELAGHDYSPPVPRGGWGNEGVSLGQEALLEWATLDAQWFGVAQRRRRVFALADFGEWYSRPPLFLESSSLRGDTAPSRKAEERVAPTVTGGPPYSRTGNERVETEALTLGYTASSFGGYTEGLDTLRANGGDLGGGSETIVMATGQAGAEILQDKAPTLNCAHEQPILAYAMQVRRLTPLECERLQGFPDNYTNVAGASDTNRYKALGNSMAVPVMHWIGKQIQFALDVQELTA